MEYIGTAIIDGDSVEITFSTEKSAINAFKKILIEMFPGKTVEALYVERKGMKA